VGAKFYISIKVLKPFDCAAFRNSDRLEFHGFKSPLMHVYSFFAPIAAYLSTR